MKWKGLLIFYIVTEEGGTMEFTSEGRGEPWSLEGGKGEPWRLEGGKGEPWSLQGGKSDNAIFIMLLTDSRGFEK